jgi:hypothetical protein
MDYMEQMKTKGIEYDWRQRPDGFHIWKVKDKEQEIAAAKGLNNENQLG